MNDFMKKDDPAVEAMRRKLMGDNQQTPKVSTPNIEKQEDLEKYIAK